MPKGRLLSANGRIAARALSRGGAPLAPVVSDHDMLVLPAEDLP
jgi:hypothetical protein